jgi:transcriptional regulator with XRE-family HTH domain
MTEATEARSRLGARLRELRRSWDGVRITQQHVAEALGLSPALVSSWESGAAVPPENRLQGYAWFFATRRTMNGRRAQLVSREDLTTQEERRRQELVDELVQLREEALHIEDSVRVVGALGGRFWHYPNAEQVTILCTPLSETQLGLTHVKLEDAPPIIQYTANPTHPNAIRAVGNGDIDGLLELVGHVRAENPTIDVRWTTFATITSVDQLTGHLIILGGGDLGGESPVESLVNELHRRLELPVYGRSIPGGDEEFDFEFIVTCDKDGNPTFGGEQQVPFGPRFLRDETAAGRPRLLREGVPVLESDVALIVRKANPLNPAATVTVCSGLFSRGTYGSVRAFTDARFRARNEQYLAENLDPDDFWMLVSVPIFAGERTVTPDLAQARLRLQTSDTRRG